MWPRVSKILLLISSLHNLTNTVPILAGYMVVSVEAPLPNINICNKAIHTDLSLVGLGAHSYLAWLEENLQSQKDVWDVHFVFVSDSWQLLNEDHISDIGEIFFIV